MTTDATLTKFSKTVIKFYYTLDSK